MILSPNYALFTYLTLTVNNNVRQQMIDAAIHYDLDVMRRLLAEGADFNAVDPDDGATLFAETIYFGASHDCITDMLQLGAKPDVAPSTGGTPLIYAVWRHDFVLIQMLLDAGANPNTPGYMDDEPMTPLDAVCNEYHCSESEPEHKLFEAMEFLLRSSAAKCYHELKALA